jgi:asparagine synthase (glutamine-hydrolysing)
LPGIAGFVDFSQTTPNSSLQVMLDQIKYSKHYAVDSSEGKCYAIGRADLPTFNPERQPSVTDHLMVFCQGNIVNKDELVAGSPSSMSNADLIAQEYGTDSTGLVSRIKGHFTAAIWDSRAERLTLVNDRFGKHELYLWSPNHETLFFASEIKCIIPIARDALRLNPRAITDFLQYQLVFGDETYFQNVRLLPQASVLQFDKQGTSIRKYWAPRPNPLAYSSLSTRDLCFRLHDLMERAVLRATQGRRVGLLLSGGLDTRNVAVHLPKLETQVHCFTHGRPDNEDTRLARAVADERDFVFHFVEITSSIIPKLSPMATWTTEGGATINIAQNMVLLDEIERSEVDVVLDGISGNPVFGLPIPYSLPTFALLSLPFLNELMVRIVRKSFSEDKCYDQARKVIRAAVHESQVSEILSDAALRDSRPLGESLQRVIREARMDFKSILDLAVFIWISQYVRRALVNPQKCCRWRVETIDVLLDYDLVDFTLNLPYKEKLWRRLVVEEIETIHPSMVPLSEDVRPASLKNLRTFLGMIAKHTPLIRRLVWSETPTPIDGYAEFLMRERSFVEKVLFSERATSRGLFNVQKVRTLFEEHMSSKVDHTRLLMRLLCLEQWFRSIEDKYGLATIRWYPHSSPE